MIVNQTTLTEADQEYLRARLRRQPAVIGVRIFIALFSLYLLITAGLLAYSEFRRESPKPVNLFFAALFLVLGIYFLYRNLFMKQTTRRSDRKAVSLTAPRSYTLDDTGITVQYTANGVETNAKYAYNNADCFWAETGAVYLRVNGQEKKQKRYMVFHDDGYSAGSRADLIALLENKGVRRMQK